MNKRSFVSQRPLFVGALVFGLGIVTGALWQGFFLLLPVFGMLFALGAATLTRQNPSIRWLPVLFAFFFLGLMLSGLAAHPIGPPEGSYHITGRVTGESERREEDGRVKALLRGVTIRDDTGVEWKARGAYWTYYPDPDAALPVDGQTAAFDAALYHPDGQVNPYGFDFSLYLLQHDIQIGISGARELVFTPSSLSAPGSVWMRAREAIAGLLDRVLGGESELAKALLIGDRTGIQDTVRDSFREAGVAHVLAVSGLHVSLLAAAVFFILRAFHLSPRVLLLCMGIFLLLYCRLLDFSSSIVRASVLTLAYLMGRVHRRRADPLTSLAAAFLLILIFRPLDLFTIGFQLSFLSVLGIFTLGDRLNAMLDHWIGNRSIPKPVIKVVQAYIITFSASVMIFFPMANAFHRFSLVGLIIGPAAVLLIGCLMSGFVLLLLLGAVYLPAAQFLAQPIILLSQTYQAGVKWAAGQPFASVPIPALPWYLIILGYAVLMLWTRYLLVRRLTRGIFSAAFLCVALIAAFLPCADAVTYIQLSAGNGDCAVIRDGPHTWVIDTGSHGGDLSSYLLSEGRAVDKLFLSHLHDDHAGGLRQLLDNKVTIREILLPDGFRLTKVNDQSLRLLNEAEQLGIAMREVSRGETIFSGRLNAYVLWPWPESLYPGLDANAGSLVMRLELDGVTLLTTGDISAEYAGYALEAAQILKVPHHGSKTDTKAGHMAMAAPGLALVTASNAHPDRYQAARENLENMGALTLVTGDTGAITLTPANGELIVREHRGRRE